MTAVPVGGTCDPRFVGLRDAFAENFSARGEPGAAIALMVGGKLVCDLWGGHRDAARQTPRSVPYTHLTMPTPSLA